MTSNALLRFGWPLINIVAVVSITLRPHRLYTINIHWWLDVACCYVECCLHCPIRPHETQIFAYLPRFASNIFEASPIINQIGELFICVRAGCARAHSLQLLRLSEKQLESVWKSEEKQQQANKPKPAKQITKSMASHCSICDSVCITTDPLGWMDQTDRIQFRTKINGNWLFALILANECDQVCTARTESTAHRMAVEC